LDDDGQPLDNYSLTKYPAREVQWTIPGLHDPVALHPVVTLLITVKRISTQPMTDAFGQLREGSGRAIDGKAADQTWMDTERAVTTTSACDLERFLDYTIPLPLWS
jgi:hypothetical protein